jgi:hypothetical protein
VWGFALIAGGEPRLAQRDYDYVLYRGENGRTRSIIVRDAFVVGVIYFARLAVGDIRRFFSTHVCGRRLPAVSRSGHGKPLAEIRLRRKRRQGRSLLNAAAKYFYDLLWVSLVGFVSTAPIILYAFCNFTAAGLVANVIVVPLVTMAVVPLSFAAALTAVFNLPGLSLIAAPLAASLEFETQIQSVLGETLNFTASPGVVTALACAAEGVALAFILWRYKFSAWKSAAAGALCARWRLRRCGLIPFPTNRALFFLTPVTAVPLFWVSPAAKRF